MVSSFHRYFNNGIKIKFSCRNNGDIKCCVGFKICDEGEGAGVTSYIINQDLYYKNVVLMEPTIKGYEPYIAISIFLIGGQRRHTLEKNRVLPSFGQEDLLK